MWLVLALAAASERAWGQAQPVDLIEIVSGGKLSGPNFFSLALDPAGNVYVGGANSGNVLRFAPRGDKPGPGGDPPCVTEILSEAKALGLEHGFDFLGPKGIAIGSDGSVYVTGTGGSPNKNDDVVRISPDGTIEELVNKFGLGLVDWNPAGLAIDEHSGPDVFVYATGPAPGPGVVVRIGPVRAGPNLDRKFRTILTRGGQGLVADETGNVYVAVVGDDAVYQIPDARGLACGDFIDPENPENMTTKECPPIIADGDVGCDGHPVHLDGPYALALAGGILYVTGQNSQNVLRRPLRPDNALGLPLCVEQIFSNGDAGLTLEQPRAIAADGSGNVYAAGNMSHNVIWIRPDPADKTRVVPQEIINRNNGLNSPPALAVDSQGNVYVSGFATSNVFRIRTVGAGLECGNGTREPGEVCDYGLDCCCSVSCNAQGTGTVCRGSAGVCDVDDTCDGVSRTCHDEFQSPGVVCRASSGVCEAPASCSGTGPDCPPNSLLLPGNPCRNAANNCDQAEQCDGMQATCPPDMTKQPGEACIPTPQDLKAFTDSGLDLDCLRETGACSTDLQCQPVPITKQCVPSDNKVRDARCVVSTACNAGHCEVAVLADGKPCGNFCDNSVCQDGNCVQMNSGEPPCGSSGCNPLNVGRECNNCPNGKLDPGEQCDDGNDNDLDGCTTHCRYACDPNDPVKSCGQRMLSATPPIPDPCERTECRAVHLDPTIENEGYECSFTSAGTGCVTSGCTQERECPDPLSSCQDKRCENNRCTYPDKQYFALATCAYSDPFPGDEGSQKTPAIDCERVKGPKRGQRQELTPNEDSPCAPTSDGKNDARTLCSLQRLEGHAKRLLYTDLCATSNSRPVAGIRRQIKHLLTLATVSANSLRSPFQPRITLVCSQALTGRFTAMLTNLKATKQTACKGFPGS
jgi:cysteine-rich repeat protein